jgi:hypothetical protein
MRYSPGGTVLRALLKALVVLVLIVPVGLLLGVFGVPVLAIGAILLVPVVLALVVIGLPFLLLLVGGAIVLGLFGTILGVGVAIITFALKFLVFVVLPVWLIWTFARFIFAR